MEASVPALFKAHVSHHLLKHYLHYPYRHLVIPFASICCGDPAPPSCCFYDRVEVTVVRLYSLQGLWSPPLLSLTFIPHCVSLLVSVFVCACVFAFVLCTCVCALACSLMMEENSGRGEGRVVICNNSPRQTWARRNLYDKRLIQRLTLKDFICLLLGV